MQCDYFDAGLCRSCTLMGVPYAAQLAEKQARVEGLLAPHLAGPAAAVWGEPVASVESGFRAKAKMVVGGTVAAPTLGILDGQRRGVDLRRCGVIAAPILDALPAIAAFITTAGLTPYSVPERRGELKNVILTLGADGLLMVRFVTRTADGLERVRRQLPALLTAVPAAHVVTVNLLPEHKAVLEGEVEHVLTPARALPMRVGDVELAALPQSFVQTNTAVAGELYRQAAAWVDEVGPASVADLYCGVGGFALHAAGAPGSGRQVVGVEVSRDAVASAELARDARYRRDDDRARIRFVADDALEWARQEAALPELVVVNPPRRGLGEPLATLLAERGPETVVYSSCNPDTLARDLAAMPGYRVERARVVDMFPQTTHVEVLTLLRRTGR
ncbi:23S rRNA m(5)U-747 methyltransferase [Microcella putealis]|uniref:23S rRNA m(5)U-747 methyltransferase n=1 Tax=Microcella putealis TaxID=337005 RepID=A0A4Q7LX85_9MICO|nr:methyltransferase domain-containing protein [Microcella putealis]RZS59635.1 23S rRNA m(5)U-747 methyltransferase [Microcella putealis]TQM26748.1 23S rRNA m(5)U-747 methyltransferase [Microcella putealis]